MTRIMHIISNLNTGGAERMLQRLVERMDPERFENFVVSMTDVGPVGEAILERGGVAVEALGMRPGRPGPRGLVRLVDLIRTARPDVVHTWMYHADLLGGLAAKFAGRPPVVWSIRHSDLDPEENKRMTIWTMRACARLSWLLPRRIVSNSYAAYDLHRDLGYSKKKLMVIPNGFDLERFKPDPTARASVLEELGLEEGVFLIGQAARFHPQKDHDTFLKAAGILHKKHPEAHFLLFGKGVTPENPQLAIRAWAEDLEEHCHFLGRRDDVARLNAALDLATTSSAFGESFPQVLGEAMACGTPCVATNVGDSASIVGPTGKIVPPRSPGALAAAWEELVGFASESRRILGKEARNRIQERFSLEKVVGRYQDLYLDCDKRR